MTFELETLFEYAKNNNLTDRKLASLLKIHYNSIYNWRHGKTEPSALAKVRIKEFLIKSL